MKLITFSLWGNNPKYTVGAIRNAQLAKSIYPDWVCRFYVGSDVDYKIVMNLQMFDNVEVVNMNKPGDWRGMFWRFEAASDSNVDVLICRDTDSRLNLREKEAVHQWIDSDKGFHIMRDHPHHGYPVLGGMWGSKSGTIPEMKNLVSDFPQTNQYGTDYNFFASIRDHLKGNIMVHDEFFNNPSNPRSKMLIDYQGTYPHNFPKPREENQYVGRPFDHNDLPCLEGDVEILYGAIR